MTHEIWTVVGDRWYTEAQLEAVEHLYGEGFLAKNPHFPDDGLYVYEDGSMSSPYPVTEQERRETFGVSEWSNFSL